MDRNHPRKLSIIFNGKDFAKAVVIDKMNQSVYQLKLYIRMYSGYKEVKFPFDLTVDCVDEVAKEVISQLNLYKGDSISIANAIHSALVNAGLDYKKNARLTMDKRSKDKLIDEMITKNLENLKSLSRRSSPSKMQGIVLNVEEKKTLRRTKSDTGEIALLKF